MSSFQIFIYPGCNIGYLARLAIHAIHLLFNLSFHACHLVLDGVGDGEIIGARIHNKIAGIGFRICCRVGEWKIVNSAHNNIRWAAITTWCA